MEHAPLKFFTTIRLLRMYSDDIFGALDLCQPWPALSAHLGFSWRHLHAAQYIIAGAFLFMRAVCLRFSRVRALFQGGSFSRRRAHGTFYPLPSWKKANCARNQLDRRCFYRRSSS